MRRLRLSISSFLQRAGRRKLRHLSCRARAGRHGRLERVGSFRDQINASESGGVAALLVPLQHRELLHRLARVDARMGVPPGGGEDLAVGAVGEALLAGMLGGDDLEGLELGVPDGFAGGERVLGDVGVGGGGEVVVFAGGEGHGEDGLGVGAGAVELLEGGAGVGLHEDHGVAAFVAGGDLDSGRFREDGQCHHHACVDG